MPSKLIMELSSADNRKEEKAKREFQKINLEEEIGDIYFQSLIKANEVSIVELVNQREYFRRVTFSADEAKYRFFAYMREIQFQYEHGISVYKNLKNDILKDNISEGNSEFHEKVISSIIFWVKNNLSYSAKIDFINNLSDDIFQVEKISDQFLYLQSLSKNDVIVADIENSSKSHIKDKPYLEDLFRSTEEYEAIVLKLVENGFISINKDKTINWKGCKEDPSLAAKTMICTLVVLLSEKDYLRPNLTNVYICEALTNSFINYEITAKTYGNTKKGFSSKLHYSKPFYFIP